MKRKWDTADDVVRRKTIDEIISRIDDIGDSSVDLIAAQEIINIVTENLGPEIYNNGLRDAAQLMKAKFEDVEIELDIMERQN